ncbi:MAG: radical SAM family heme chaperone HemW [Acidimicrobiales bacterium]
MTRPTGGADDFGLSALELAQAGLPPISPGVYVHVPFCSSRCDYCAFTTFTDRHHLASSYVDACLSDYESHREAWPAGPGTIFIGGGTPSQLSGHDLRRLVAALDAGPGAEVTAEANPEDVTPAWVASCRAAGVNRISLGVQSLDPAVLKGLGRQHDPASVAVAVGNIAAAGIDSYSVDLIYGGAGETNESWARTLEGVQRLDPRPGHVSAYGLTVEPGTPLALDPSRHPDDDTQAARYEIAEQMLSENGYSWYEISNWSLPGQASRHNLNYWMEGDYLGLGCAAHSHRAGRRWWNVRTPERYIDLIATGASPESVSETLTAPQRRLESLELAVRTRLGVPRAALAAALESEPAIAELVATDPISRRLVLTLRGRLLANEVACRLRPDAPEVAEMTSAAR